MEILKATGLFTVGYIITGVGSNPKQYTALEQVGAIALVTVVLYLWWCSR